MMVSEAKKAVLQWTDGETLGTWSCETFACIALVPVTGGKRTTLGSARREEKDVGQSGRDMIESSPKCGLCGQTCSASLVSLSDLGIQKKQVRL